MLLRSICRWAFGAALISVAIPSVAAQDDASNEVDVEVCLAVD